MDNDRWSMFGWGIGLGLLIGAGIVGGYCWPRIVAAEAAEEAAKAKAYEEWVHAEITRLVGNPDSGRFEPARTHDLGRLSFHDAQTLSGQAVRVIFTVDSLEGEYAGCVTVDAEALPGVSSTIHFAPGQQPDALDMGSRFIVEGEMRARIVPGRLIDGARFEGVLVVDVVGARVVSRP
jgi:hypothetical protein